MKPPHFEIEGHVYYLTIVVYHRLPIFSRPSFIIPLIDSLNFYRYKLDFKLLGYVIMPDHLHLIIWPLGKASVADIMRDYKEFTAKRIVRQAEVEQNTEWALAFQQAGQETGRSQNKVWQDSYWDENIFTVNFLKQKIDYIHNNPIRAGLVDSADKYPYSSFRNYYLNDDSLIEIDKDWN